MYVNTREYGVPTRYDPSSQYERIDVVELLFRHPWIALKIIKTRWAYRLKYGTWKTYYK